MTRTVFIDGDAGTTGLQVRARLEAHGQVSLMPPLDAELRKDASARRDAMAAADAVILCLPDAAAREAADMAEKNNFDCVMIDASTAHRVDDGWVYGFPELGHGQREKIRNAKRIANPGCYATSMIAMIRPLVDAGVIKADDRLFISALCGYSGGGKNLINYMEGRKAGRNFSYATELNHKHLPEVMKHGGLATPPVFTPMVADFECGMIVQLPLAGIAEGRDGITEIFKKHYADEQFVKVSDAGDALSDEGYLLADALLGSNMLEITVLGNDAMPLVTARLDNLGKGASGAAVQNLNIAFGLDEAAGFDLSQSSTDGYHKAKIAV